MVLGTMQSNRVGIPAEIKETKTKIFEQRDILGKRWINEHFKIHSENIQRKDISHRPINARRNPRSYKNDEKKRPAAYKLYDFTKGGTDIVDQKMSFYTCKAKSRKWTMVLFAYLLDTIRVNSATLYEDPTK